MHVVTPPPNNSSNAPSSKFAIMESKHSRGELLACCQSRAIAGLVQKLDIMLRGLLMVLMTADNPRSVAVDTFLQDEKQVLSKFVAAAAGSRG